MKDQRYNTRIHGTIGGMCPSCGGFDALWDDGSVWECEDCRILLSDKLEAPKGAPTK